MLVCLSLLPTFSLSQYLQPKLRLPGLSLLFHLQKCVLSLLSNIGLLLRKKEWENSGQCYNTFTVVIYHHYLVIPSLCVLKLYYLENYNRMAVNYYRILTLECRVKITAVIYCGIAL
jgi:hypothetical protein